MIDIYFIFHIAFSLFAVAHIAQKDWETRKHLNLALEKASLWFRSILWKS